MNLTDKRILITRPRAQAEEFMKTLRELGAWPIRLPVIEITPVADTTVLDRALTRLHCYDWIVLTSVNGVDAVWDRLSALGIQVLPGSLRVAAIGSKTAAALEAHSVSPDFIPEEYITEAILPGLGDLCGRWVLLPSADLARSALPHAINVADGIAHVVTTYHTIPAKADSEGLQALQEGVDIVTFTSSSTVRNFIALTRSSRLDPHHLPGNPLVACIGPITAETAGEAGLLVDIVAEEYTVEGLLQALLNYNVMSEA